MSEICPSCGNGYKKWETRTTGSGLLWQPIAGTGRGCNVQSSSLAAAPPHCAVLSPRSAKTTTLFTLLLNKEDSVLTSIFFILPCKSSKIIENV